MAGRQVYAHYMLGLTYGQTPEQWAKEINDAKAVGIDGFALNVGPHDSWTWEQVNHAYVAAENAGFQMFISFDMAVGEWSPQAVIDLINAYKDSPAQTRVNGAPMVSTFEGPGWSGNWPGVRDAVGGLYLVPDWSSLGPYGLDDSKMSVIDGHCKSTPDPSTVTTIPAVCFFLFFFLLTYLTLVHWGAWPNAGQLTKDPADDVLYKNMLNERSKSYMMGVSPWFYTNLPQYSKNWFFSSDSLWFDRWQQAIDLLPEFIEIITWNDFGEASYISDLAPQQVVAGANAYVDGHDHAAFRAVLPYFIQAYKQGKRALDQPPADEAIAYYRTTPAHAGPNGGTIWGQTGGLNAADGAIDAVNVITVTVDETELIVSIGGNNQSFTTGGGDHPAKYHQVPFNGFTGDVTLYMNGREVTGPAITNTLPATGYVNFNSLAIRL
ncbi:Glucan endo-1,3-alpha-glucosidase agn1 [Paramyrothecium foliicola]|nr:Glucan endo-1,3-alpha-glucosidase agn1 [Paramyrothecium foliicola]